MERLLLVIQIVLLYSRSGESVRCFECDSVPNPISCGEITTCEQSQSCFIEQVVTTSGNVVYNSGCESNSRCQSLNGRRSITRRNSDIVTCRECCQGPFCNNQGCGNPGIDKHQRGPYCYNCPYLTDPGACETVSICKPQEKCVTYERQEFVGLQGINGKVYSSECEAELACQSLEKIHRGECCQTDFCNDYYNTSIAQPITPAPTPAPTAAPTDPPTAPNTPAPTTAAPQVATQPPGHHCDTSGHFVRIPLSNNQELCVKVVESDPKDWPNAKASCEAHNARLVVTNTEEKSDKLSAYLKKYWSHHNNFWIGLWDRDGNDKFYWLTNELNTVDGWRGASPKQPTNVYHGKDEDCVYLYRGDHHWHDTWCEHHEAYICERV